MQIYLAQPRITQLHSIQDRSRINYTGQNLQTKMWV